jgi:chemotaxis protein CheD
MSLMSRHPVAVVQGEFLVSADPELQMSTILGSCVAVCLHDPDARIGGMNHFLLPFGQEEGTNRPMRYGVFAMEMLINGLMKEGARKSRLQAKIFGGARITADLRGIGPSNAAFARDFLATENIPCLAESLGGSNARRLVFQPATGHVRMMLVPPNTVEVERPRPPNPPGDGVELF